MPESRTDTFWAIRRRERAKHAAPEPPAEKPKKAKKLKEAPVEESIEEAPVAEVEAESDGEQEAAAVQDEAEEVAE